MDRNPYQKTQPYSRSPEPGTSWWYLGHLITSLAEGAETAEQLSAVEATIRKGAEPPPHLHTREDEAFYILDGHFTFTVGDRTIDGPPGTFVWLPRGLPHTFEVDADGARALILALPGGHLESMFRPFSEPAGALVLPSPPQNPPYDEILALDAQLGVEYPAMT